MNITVRDGLPFVAVTLTHHGRSIQLGSVLLDTGSAGTVFATDRVIEAGVQMEPDDVVHRIRGVGGSEFVFGKRIDELKVGEDLQANDFEVEVGALAYGFDLDGILGLDFLIQVGAVINLDTLKLQAAE